MDDLLAPLIPPEASAGLPPIRQAAAALCWGLRGDQCHRCLTAEKCTRYPALNCDARLAVAAYLRATGRAPEAVSLENERDE